ncbi:hypothetical protein [Zooshikella ganghwensis]|uniref:hypothetical protein n=1 Tax=Zooshikella ganghwensis TaxID=202772 RepID=UPI0004166E6B|nr:hypothetical protein [Zooshikella ganghwensis]
MQNYTKNDIIKIASNLGISCIDDNWTGIDSILPLIEKIREDGAIFIIKFDGERNDPSDNGKYSFLIFGRPLNDINIKTDANTLDEGLIYVIGKYADTVWDIEL